MSGKELARLGFFQDFDELDLEALLETAAATVSVATRREDTLTRAPAAITIVNDEQLRSLGARKLADVLPLLPGFDVLRDSLGRARLVVRGMGLDGVRGGSEGVLVLLNGQRLNEALSGSATAVNLDLSVEHVRRIEIWRGVGSALYGGGAQRAVVNLVTHTARDFQGVQLAAELGTFGLQDYTLRLANSFKGVSFSALVQWSDLVGARLDVPRDRQTERDERLAALGVPPVSLAPGTVRDGRQQFQSVYVVSYGDFSLQWRSQREQADGYVGFADTLGRGNDVDARQSGLSLGYKHALPNGRIEARAGLVRSRSDETLNFAPAGFALPLPAGGQVRFPSGVYLQTLLKVDRHEGELLIERRAGAHGLVAGVELARERSSGLDVRSNLDYLSGNVLTDVSSLPGAVSEPSRNLAGAWLQDTWSRGRVGLTAGLRFDHVSDAGDHVSPRVALLVEARDDLGVQLSYGRGFRAPSFEELYFNLPGRAANPALAAPRVETVEGALNYRMHDTNVALRGFWSRERDPVRLPEAFDPDVQQAWVNGPDLVARGLELELERTFGLENSVFANWTYQRVEEDLAGGRVRAGGVPSQLANAGLTLALGRHVLVSPSVSWRGRRPRSAGDPRPAVDAYALANLTLRVRRLYRTLELAGSFQNLLDERYVDPAPAGGLLFDYPRAGRSARVQASYRF